MDYGMIKRDFYIVNIAAGTAVVLMMISVVMQHVGILPMMPCLFHDILHLYCPGCGGTRAVTALIHGHILESLYCNPAVLFGGLLILYYEVGAVLTVIKKDGRFYFSKKLWPVYAYLILIGCFFVVRNVLLWGFGFDMLGDFLK